MGGGNAENICFAHNAYHATPLHNVFKFAYDTTTPLSYKIHEINKNVDDEEIC